jgi:hypothetical protein
MFGSTPDGRAVGPAGRLGQTTYPASFVDEVSSGDFFRFVNIKKWDSFIFVPYAGALQCLTSACGPARPPGHRARTQAARTDFIQAHPSFHSASVYLTQRGNTHRLTPQQNTICRLSAPVLMRIVSTLRQCRDYQAHCYVPSQPISL